MTASSQKLRGVNNFSSLVSYLRNELKWPIETDNWDDLTFEYDPEELGLQKEYGNAIHKLWQLRPLNNRQPWGIFFVEFKKKKLPIVVLRRILRGLVIRKRASAKAAEKPSWAVDDLLFISALGDEKERELTFAHFKTSEADLPTLRVLEWDGGDTIRKLEFLDDTLHQHLSWPQDTSKPKEWLENWSKPFRHTPRHTIRTANELAEALAHLAIRIREAAKTVMKAESERGKFRALHKAFKESLLQGLEQDEFADTYAQTITYGLLTAAISRTDMSAGKEGTAVIVENVADMVPITNPFLKEILQEFLLAGGRKGKLDFDELGVQDVAELLRGEDTDLPAVIRDFGHQTRGEDPVIHFYEHFLAAYDKAQKKQRGVFYTPQSVVSYIVRSVHELLQTEFGLADGLADTATWGEMLKKHPGLKLPPLTDEPGEKRTISPDEPFVQILDPATGTATFLVEVIDIIHKTLIEKWRKEGISQAEQVGKWNEYVPRNLLPRLHAYELMMAPYAIAHMKIGLKLAETGYRFGSEERARIYLTNALEPWVKQLPLIGFEALAHEAEEVNNIKKDKRFTVVIGNPPYAGVSANHSEWITGLIDTYRFVDGNPLEEKKVWLKNDYVKFLRLAQFAVDTTGRGVVGMITDHSYLDSPTFRGLRNNLLKSFTDLRFLNLHGNSKRREKDPAGGLDENVFDIMQGVAVGLFAKTGAADNSASHADIWGGRQEKYKGLACLSAVKTKWTPIIPKPEFYLFTALSQSASDEYDASWSITDIFLLGSNGVQTSRDSLVLAATRKELTERFEWIRSKSVSDAEILKTYELEDKSFWQLRGARAALNADPNWAKRIMGYAYRPFEKSWLYASPDFVHRLRREVMEHMEHPNLALCVGRAGLVVDGFWNLVFVANTVCDHNFFYRGSSLNCPLYCYNEDELMAKATPAGQSRTHNLGHRFLVQLAHSLKLEFDRKENLPTDLTPEDVFHYVYSVFHSPGYRSRYAEFLKIDFPRLPLTGNLELFRALARLGGELTALHLLESPRLVSPITEFIGSRNPEVEKVSWCKNIVWIDKAQTIGFRGVREDVWNFHIGGYQVCEKWLKDRKDKKLTKDDITHYQKVVVALSETIRLMKEIDVAIDKHGGWPGAFK